MGMRAGGRERVVFRHLVVSIYVLAVFFFNLTISPRGIAFSIRPMQRITVGQDQEELFFVSVQRMLATCCTCMHDTR